MNHTLFQIDKDTFLVERSYGEKKMKKHARPFDPVYLVPSKDKERNILLALRSKLEATDYDPAQTWLEITPVYQGLEFSASYELGVLREVVMRGDGIFGEEVTDIARGKLMPLRLDEPRSVVVHGTFLLPRSRFLELLKQEQELSPKKLGVYSMEQLMIKAMAGKAVSPVMDHIQHRIINISHGTNVYRKPSDKDFRIISIGLTTAFSW